jgi:hypothetical protein
MNYDLIKNQLWIKWKWTLFWLEVSQPHFEGSVRSPLTLPKMGLRSPSGLPKVQNTIAGDKTPCIEVFFILLEISWGVDVRNGLTWAIRTSTAQVMVKRRAGSQTGSLIPDHKKSRIDSIPVCAGGMRHTVGKLSRRATSSLQTLSQSEVGARSYERPKSQESKPGQFRDSFGTPFWESRDKEPFGCERGGVM